ncbi:MAG TPA: hypothetical protein VGC60_09635 [Pyrinomonadaceae bacterium]|jgi:hypothetical protein
MNLDAPAPAIDSESRRGDEGTAVAEAIERDRDLSSGKIDGRTHEEVMETVRRALQEIAA